MGEKVMAQIVPFRGIRYDPAKISDLSLVIAPPYDVIAPAYQDVLHQRHPFNVVRLILGEEHVGDDARSNWYQRAAHYWEQWQRGVLVRDEKPAIYIYDQTFETPDGATRTRRGLVCAVRLEDFRSGVVRPHERTLAAPKADRLRLFRACHANFSSIFSLYDDPQHTIASLLAPHALHAPHAEATSDDHVHHRLWKVDDTATIQAVQAAFADKPLFIADGHHRYETALTYRDEQRAQSSRWTGDEPANFVMMTLVNVHDPGLVVLPYHRLIANLPAETLSDFGERLGAFFDVLPVSDAQSLMPALRRVPEKHIFGCYEQDEPVLLALHDDAPYRSLLDETRSPAFNELDVTLLHALVIENLLGITPEQLVSSRYVSYTSDDQQAIAAVDTGKAELALLLRPTRIEQVLAVANAGDQMPQKSTYFYPKVITGMVMRSLED
jgi:uncharacterized protein (DUF1015 family)